jgi:MFS family permease
MSMFGVLRARDFRLLFVGQTLSLLGSAIATVAMVFAVLSIGGSTTDIGIVGGAALLPLVLFMLVGGVWGDRLPRQWVMLVSDLVRFGCQAAVAALLLAHVATVWELAALAFVRGAAEAFFRPAQTGLVPQTVSAARLQQANALRGLTESLGVTVGAALGGVLVATIGPGWAIGIDSLSYVASAAFLWELRGLAPAAPTSLSAAAAGLTAGLDDGIAGTGAVRLAVDGVARREGFIKELREGWQEFRSRTWLWLIVAEAAVFHLLIIAPLMVLGPKVAELSLGGAAAWGAILAARGAGEIAGGVAGLRLRPARPLLLCGWLTFIEAPLFAFFALGYGILALVAASVVAGIAAALVNVLWETTLQEQIPPEALSRVSAFDWMGSLAFFPLGMFLAGPIAAVIGISGSFALATVATVLSALVQIAVPSVRRVRCRRTGVPSGALV